VTDQQLQFPATKPAFEQAFADLRVALDVRGLHGRARNQAELVFEEVVSNVVRHGCGDGRAHRIVVSLAGDAHALVLTFDDDGLPFNPLDQPIPTLPTSLDDAPLGGLGLLLVHRASKDLRYERTSDHKNRLTVTIAIA